MTTVNRRVPRRINLWVRIFIRGACTLPNVTQSKDKKNTTLVPTEHHYPRLHVKASPVTYALTRADDAQWQLPPPIFCLKTPLGLCGVFCLINPRKLLPLLLYFFRFFLLFSPSSSEDPSKPLLKNPSSPFPFLIFGFQIPPLKKRKTTTNGCFKRHSRDRLKALIR